VEGVSPFLSAGSTKQISRNGEIMKKSVIVIVASLFLLSLIHVALAQTDLNAKVKEAMASFKDKMAKLGEGQAEASNLTLGTTKLNENYSVVDELKGSFNCTATIFVKNGTDFIRISTNVMKDGKRALGTKLDSVGKAYAALIKGEAFYGKVDILGNQYEAGYEPIKNTKNEVIGALYIGFKL
jgi:hypothetical protein